MWRCARFLRLAVDETVGFLTSRGVFLRISGPLKTVLGGTHTRVGFLLTPFNLLGVVANLVVNLKKERRK